ncbi:putative G patch domain-containing protein [Helianthus annuus]|nr:putative G patch domain-containing protein [Helianthus annuus]
MADEDDDYMGDLSKFLSSQPETSTNPPAKKVYNTSSSSSKSTSLQPSKKRQKTLNWQQQRKQKREIKQAQEDEQTLASLESAIPQSNIGFKMLKQMGYTPGSGLGGCRVKERWRSKRVVVNFYKAKGVLDQLENKEVVELEKKDEDDGGDEEEEEEEVITEEDLHEILMKLRDNFHYCLFCGCQYESMDALLDNCPGINEDDH